MKVRKKSIIVEVEQFTGELPHPRGVCTCGRMLSGIDGGCQPHVHTIHNGQRIDLKVGDWVFPEPDGIHFYPVDAAIFESLWEKV